MKNKSAAKVLDCAIEKIRALHSGGARINYSIVHPEQRLYIETWIIPNLQKVLAVLNGDKMAAADLKSDNRRGLLS